MTSNANNLSPVRSGMTRRAVLATFIAAELWQLFFGAFSSLQLGAPGVGDRASWVPNVLVAETFTLLPLGFIGVMWGRPAGRWLGVACGIASLAIAVAATMALSSPTSSFLYGLPFLSPRLASRCCCARGGEWASPRREMVPDESVTFGA